MSLESSVFDLFFRAMMSSNFHAVTVKFHGERKNKNKGVFLFGYSVGNDYLCRDFSAKAIKDIFHHSIV